MQLSCLLEAEGYDLSIAKHSDAVWCVLREGGQWAAQYETALPRHHLKALTSLRFGTAPLMKSVQNDVAVAARLCPFCLNRGMGSKAVIEDEAHLCFDCPVYNKVREQLVYELQGVKQPLPLQATESEAARALGGLLNPGSFTAARAVAKFACEALKLRAKALESGVCLNGYTVKKYRVCSAAIDGESYDAYSVEQAVTELVHVDGLGDEVWIKRALGEWVGMEIPRPTKLSWLVGRLNGPASPIWMPHSQQDLGNSTFYPHEEDERLRCWIPSR